MFIQKSMGAGIYEGCYQYQFNEDWDGKPTIIVSKKPILKYEKIIKRQGKTESTTASIK